MKKVHGSFCFSPYHIKFEKAIVLEHSPTIRAILQMLERPEKEKKQAESQNSNMQSRYFLYFVYALQRAEKRPSTV
jgi:hypothetical protein